MTEMPDITVLKAAMDAADEIVTVYHRWEAKPSKAKCRRPAGHRSLLRGRPGLPVRHGWQYSRMLATPSRRWRHLPLLPLPTPRTAQAGLPDPKGTLR